MSAFLFAFAAGMAWGSADYVGGVMSRTLTPQSVAAVTHAVGLPIVAVAVIALDAGAIDAQLVAVGGLAGVAQGVGIGSYYRSLAVGAMGIVAPIMASAAVIPVVFGIAGGERPGALQGAGMLLTLTGIAMTAYERGNGDDKKRAGSLALGVGFALFAAFFIGLFFVGLAEASNHGSVMWAVLVSRVTSVAVLVVMAVGASGWVRVEASHLPALGTVGILSIAAALLFAQATTLGLVSVVAVIGALYPVATVLLARTILQERLGLLQRAGAVLALMGVAAIVAG